MSPTPSLRARVTTFVLAAALVLAACGGSAAEDVGVGADVGAEADAPDSFTFAISVQPNLNPYLADPNPYNQWVLALAYEPLIRRTPDLQYTGGLAESFAYTDQENKVFEISLRDGLTFSDRTPLDADAVVASLEYFMSDGLNARTWGSTIESVEAVDPRTVRVTNRSPNPDMPFVLSNSSLAGFVISPEGLANTSRLGQATYGAGPYVLDVEGSALGSRYVFRPNPNYWDQSAIHWDEVVALQIPDPNSAISALRIGQVDYIGSAVNLLPEIEAAGLEAETASAGVVGVSLADRDGTVAEPLADVRVRQALNYAIDREAILAALYAGYGTVTTQLTSEGYEGWDGALDSEYAYDPERARELLSEAGYPEGFPLRMLAQSYIGQDVLAQAIAAQWSEIGVEVEMTTEAQLPQVFEQAMGREYPVTPFTALNASMFLLSTNFLAPHPNPGNPFGTVDPELVQMLEDAAATADEDDRAARYREAMHHVVAEAWFAPVVTIDGVAAGSDRITGWQGGAFFDPTRVTPRLNGS